MPSEGVSRPEPSPFYIKPTYAALCDAINKASVRLHESHFKAADNQAIEHLRDQVFLSPRLPQWNRVGNNLEYYFTSGEWRVHVTPKSTYLSHGEERYFFVEGTPAETLFASLETSQSIVKAPDPHATPDDDYFGAGSGEEFFASAGLDAALEESHSDALIEEDAELMEEITGHSEEAYKDGEPGQIAVEDVEPETTQVRFHQERVEEVAAKSYVGKINKSAAAEGIQLKKEFPSDIEDRYKDKDPVQDCPRMETTRVVQHFKSLQGNILNIVEASFADVEQRKAVKTLINKAFRAKMNNLNNGWSQDED